MNNIPLLWRSLIIAGACLLLAACSFPPPTQYAFIPPKKQAARRCIASCIMGRNQCHLQCQTRNANIEMQRQAAAEIARKEQRHAEHHHHHNSDLSIGFYSDDDFAAPTSCGCANTFRQCYSMCGGKVIAVSGPFVQAPDSMLPVPKGSYQASCGGCHFNGTKLSCRCLTGQRRIRYSILDMSNTTCRADIINNNGKLIAVCSQ